MTNELTIFNYGAAVVRTVVIDGEPWFVAKDVCDVLDIYTKDLNDRLDADEKSYVGRTDLGLNPGKPMLIISESGVYAAIMRSDKQEAIPFRKWVTSEVLPTIRKTGGVYMSAEKAEEILANPDLIIGLAQQVKQLKHERDEAIRTKAHVAAGREGTLFGKVGNLSKENKKLKEQLGVHGNHLAVKAIPWINDVFRTRLPGTWIVIGQKLREISIQRGPHFLNFKSFMCTN